MNDIILKKEETETIIFLLEKKTCFAAIHLSFGNFNTFTLEHIGAPWHAELGGDEYHIYAKGLVEVDKKGEHTTRRNISGRLLALVTLQKDSVKIIVFDDVTLYVEKDRSKAFKKLKETQS